MCCHFSFVVFMLAGCFVSFFVFRLCLVLCFTCVCKFFCILCDVRLLCYVALFGCLFICYF